MLKLLMNFSYYIHAFGLVVPHLEINIATYENYLFEIWVVCFFTCLIWAVVGGRGQLYMIPNLTDKSYAMLISWHICCGLKPMLIGLKHCRTLYLLR